MTDTSASAASPLKTKDGIEVKLGQRWRDCDKRMDRKRYVVEIDVTAGKVRMGVTMDDTRGSWVSVRRMYKHSTGWELIG